MLKRLLALLMLLMLPVTAPAENTPEYQVFTFAGTLPDRLIEPLGDMISPDAHILSGAAIQHNGYHVSGNDSPATLDCISALVLVNTDDGLHLYAAAQPEGLPWEVSDYTHFLRQGTTVSVGIYQPESNRIPMFSVDYGVQGGTMSDLFIFRHNMLWCINGHINTANGTSIAVYTDSLSLKDNAGYQEYVSCRGFWLDYMESIDEFPATRSELETMEDAAHTAIASNAVAGLAYAQDVHLRAEATAKSESLGQYNQNVPVVLLGEKINGTNYPWLKVRIGNTEGWMSSNYIYDTYLQPCPVPLGRTVDGCAMYADLDGAQPISQLEPGTTFHVLTEVNGMYHICIPQGEISWEVDVDGTYGYIFTADALTGYSPSALDALENAR